MESRVRLWVALAFTQPRRETCDRGQQCHAPCHSVCRSCDFMLIHAVSTSLDPTRDRSEYMARQNDGGSGEMAQHDSSAFKSKVDEGVHKDEQRSVEKTYHGRTQS